MMLTARTSLYLRTAAHRFCTFRAEYDEKANVVKVFVTGDTDTLLHIATGCMENNKFVCAELEPTWFCQLPNSDIDRVFKVLSISLMAVIMENA